jgi:hypothetical protein
MNPEVIGKEPTVQARTWSDILNIQLAKDARKKDQAQETDRQRLERDGWRTTFHVPHQDKFLSNHAFLLDHVDGEEHICSVLSSIGIVFHSYVPALRELKVTFSGDALKEFFVEYLDRKGKKLNASKPVIPVVFWGDLWVSKKFKESSTKESEMIRKYDVKQLEAQGGNHEGKIVSKYKRVISEKERVVGELTTTELSAPEEQRVHIRAQIESEKAALEGIVLEKGKKLIEVRKLWSDRVLMREKFEESVARKRKQAQEAVDEGKRRKASNVEASEAMAAEILANATAAAKEAAPEAPEVAAPAAVAPAAAPPAAEAAEEDPIAAIARQFGV